MRKLSAAALKNIDEHLKWLERCGGKQADLQRVDLEGAQLQGADIDYSCWPLWCGGLDVHLDNEQLKQIAYHLVRNGLFSNKASDETKEELRKILDFANESHLVGMCGVIKDE